MDKIAKISAGRVTVKPHKYQTKLWRINQSAESRNLVME